MDEAKEKEVFHSRPIFYGFLALLLAISTTRYIFAGNLKYIIFVALIAVSFLVYCIVFKKWASLVVVFAILLFGCGWYFLGISNFQGKTFEEPCQVIGRITDDVSYSTYGNQATVILDDVKINGKQENNIRLTIKISSKDDFEIGNIVSFESYVGNAKLFTLGKFNSFYYRDGTPYISTVKASDLTVSGNKLKFDEKVRQFVKNKFYSNVGEDNGAVAYAVLFGDKTDIDSQTLGVFKSAGVVHLLTVSGLHVTFLIGLLGFILKKCKISGVWNFVFCALTLGFYAYICGFAPSVMRAGIMGLVLLLARISGKCYDNLNTLGLAGIIILLYSPLSALDVGFLMSFFCVLGIFIVYPLLSSVGNKILPKFIAESLAVSLSAQIGVLPFMAIMYSDFNFLSIFANLLIIPMFSVLYPFLFACTFLVMVMPFLGFLLKVCGFGFDIISLISSFFSTTNFVVSLEAFNIFLVGLIFILLFLASRYFMVNKRAKIVCCSSVFALICVTCAIFSIPMPTKQTIVYGYNYSQSVLLLTNKSGESVIVDPTYYSYTRELLNVCNVKNVEIAFVLQNSTILIDTMDKIGVNNIVRCDGGQGYDNEQLIDTNIQGRIGGFSFEYKSYNQRLLGLEIAFDDIKIFVLRDINQTDVALNTVTETDYDVVILGRHDAYAEKFQNCKCVLTYYENKNADFSFLKNGNMACDINGKNLKWRCID